MRKLATPRNPNAKSTNAIGIFLNLLVLKLLLVSAKAQKEEEECGIHVTEFTCGKKKCEWHVDENGERHLQKGGESSPSPPQSC